MLTKTELPAFDNKAAGKRCVSSPDISGRPYVAGVAVQIVGTKTGGTGILTAAEAIEYILILHDGVEKMRVHPSLQLKHDSILNSNDDALDDTYVFIPFYRRGQAWSLLGTAGIPRLQIVVQLKASAALPTGGTINDLRGEWAYVETEQPAPTGRKFVQGIFTWDKTRAGWNVIEDLAYDGISRVSELILDHNAITEVEVSIGNKGVYKLRKEAALAMLGRNNLYKRPSTADFFPVLFDDFGTLGDFADLIVNGVRRPLKIRFYWDTNIAAVASFDILAEAVEEAITAPVATARA